jgi:hypothetical protein
MPKSVNANTVTKFFKLRSQGYSVNRACLEAGVSRSYITRHGYDKLEAPPAEEFEDKRFTARFKTQIMAGGTESAFGPIPYDRLSDEAKRAWDDFGYFRARYFGRVSTPWQVETAHRVLECLDNDDLDYLVENCPPGAGKSTLVVDIAAWVTVRNRQVRGCIGSRTGANARKQVNLLRRMLEYGSPPKASLKEKELGLAVDAVATLAEDYGMFKPNTREVWTREAFFVAQAPDQPIADKEPTWSAYGVDEGVLGNRFNLVFWDDLVDAKNVKLDAARDLESKWDSELESRLEPGGTHMLVGQRIAASDLYRYCLNKRMVATDEDGEDIEDADAVPVYQHIVYRAHYDELCRGRETHHRNAPAYPDGCLLDPKRLSWKTLRKKQVNDRNYRVQYLQEDTDPDDVLVPLGWVDGGVDPHDGTEHPGCWDSTRGEWELPESKGLRVGFVTVDPSPTKYWAIQFWVADPQNGNTNYLVSTIRRKLAGSEVLEYDPNRRVHYGVFEEIWQQSLKLGVPARHWVIEINSERFLTEQRQFKDWASSRGIAVHRQQTNSANKNNADLGPDVMREHFREGRVRLPGKGAAHDMSMHLVNEITHYPYGTTTDQVMACWFYFKWSPQIVTAALGAIKDPPKFWRPSWISENSRMRRTV